ncbi:MAG: hypothetical protein ACI8Z5_002660 [Lentimonas sp.]|jgi:hypothetical protein
MHLLFGADSEPEMSASAPAVSNPAVKAVQQRNERIVPLEERVELLEAKLDELRATFAEFRKQFE